MRVLSDFDGVLTDITHEAARVTNLFLDALRGTGVRDEHAIHQLAHRAYEEMAHDPTRHGWRVGGRITAFANEDGFIRSNALAACLDDIARRGDQTARDLVAALERQGVPNFTALGQRAFEEMVRETAAGEIRPLDPAAAAVLKALLARGIEVVVVSNSGTARIQQLLKGAGLEPRSDQAAGPGHLRVRGGARKFILSHEARGFEANGYGVSTDRPHYEEILLEERPDVIVGDVFSLDLALPLEFARRGMIAPRLLLRRRPYTPAWSVDYLTVHAAEWCRVIDQIEELL
jgi:phosphoglycolate phosphatase-like HAD superfamily hydrolase